MPSLLELQRDLGRALREPGGAVPPWIAGDDAAERLAIYRGTIDGTLVKALRLNFPTVQRLVGPEFFDGAASLFAQVHAATAADLNAYGIGFPNFLAGLPQCAGLAYLPDVARLDWAVARALHAPDARPLAPEALAGWTERADGLCFTAHPSVSLVRSAFPIHAIWHAVLARDDAQIASIDLSAGPVHLIVQRLDDDVEAVAIEASEWRFAEALLTGHRLGRLLELDEIDAAPCLARHLAAGRIVAFTTWETEHEELASCGARPT